MGVHRTLKKRENCKNREMQNGKIKVVSGLDGWVVDTLDFARYLNVMRMLEYGECVRKDLYDRTLSFLNLCIPYPGDVCVCMRVFVCECERSEREKSRIEKGENAKMVLVLRLDMSLNSSAGSCSRRSLFSSPEHQRFVHPIIHQSENPSLKKK